MKYGIDLGTTNSAICKMEHGEPVIKKADDESDIMPSCVSFRKRITKVNGVKQETTITQVGSQAYNDLRQDKELATKSWTKEKENVFIEFKRTMGLDKKYFSPNLGKSISSEDLSAFVLKQLKSFVGDENIDASVITIPAKFTPDQIAATKRAASLAGINHCELLQEPIAAAMAYGLRTEDKNGHWIVFDFGGGTFDSALLMVEDGILQVTDTEGDNYLGGKDLDFAIVDEIILPYLQKNYSIDNILSDSAKKEILRHAVKFYAEQAKNQLSFNKEYKIYSYVDEFGNDDDGNPIDLDFTITQEDVEPIFSKIFQKAVDITNGLIKRNNLEGKIDKLILVGGPTYSPILRRMLKEQVTPNVDTDIDPMTAVAKGATLYASGIDYDSKVSAPAGTVNLDVKYNSSSVAKEEYVTVKLQKHSSKDVPDNIQIEFVKKGKGVGWTSGRIPISQLGELITCPLDEGKANSFDIKAYDEKGNSYPCSPDNIVIIQGTSVGSAILPRNIGIEVKDSLKNKDIFVPLKGLEKNKELPAVGVRNGLMIQNDIRPGISDDHLIIPIYVGENASEGSSAIYNDHVFDVVITGDDIPQLLAKDSQLDITIKVDRSQLMTMEAFFPSIGFTVKREINVQPRSIDDVKKELLARKREADRKMRTIQNLKFIGPEEKKSLIRQFDDINQRWDGEFASEDGQMHLLASLREAFRSLESLEQKHEWDIVKSELTDEFNKLKAANEDVGQHRFDDEVNYAQEKINKVFSSHDISSARALLQQIDQSFFNITYPYQLMGCIQHYSERFHTTPWKNKDEADRLLAKGRAMINSDKIDLEELRDVCLAVLDLVNLPANQKPKI